MLTTKTRRCKFCKAEFTPMSTTQKVCSFGCAIDLGVAEKQKAQRKADVIVRRADKVTREGQKSRSDYIKEAKKSFNLYIRTRDAGKPCICCGKPQKAHDSISGHNVDAGHYRSVGSAPHLRFVENNCHAQLVVCNRWGAGRAVDYRLGLIARIGLEAVEALEADQEPRRYTVDELKSIKTKYAAMARELRSEKC